MITSMILAAVATTATGGLQCVVRLPDGAYEVFGPTQDGCVLVPRTPPWQMHGSEGPNYAMRFDFEGRYLGADRLDSLSSLRGTTGIGESVLLEQRHDELESRSGRSWVLRGGSSQTVLYRADDSAFLFCYPTVKSGLLSYRTLKAERLYVHTVDLGSGKEYFSPLDGLYDSYDVSSQDRRLYVMRDRRVTEYELETMMRTEIWLQMRPGQPIEGLPGFFCAIGDGLLIILANVDVNGIEESTIPRVVLGSQAGASPRNPSRALLLFNTRTKTALIIAIIDAHPYIHHVSVDSGSPSRFVVSPDRQRLAMVVSGFLIVFRLPGLSRGVMF